MRRRGAHMSVRLAGAPSSASAAAYGLVYLLWGYVKCFLTKHLQ